MPGRQLAQFDFKSWRQIYDTGKFTIAGNPAQDGRGAELWALDSEGRVAMTGRAKLS
jgi:hydroxyacyl-ACP dehydratase HTD2-like protein with hotdog domain